MARSIAPTTHYTRPRLDLNQAHHELAVADLTSSQQAQSSAPVKWLCLAQKLGTHRRCVRNTKGFVLYIS